MAKNAMNNSWTAEPYQLVGRLVIFGALVSAGCAGGHAPTSQLAWDHAWFFDLTHAFEADTVVWPTEQDFKLIPQHAEEMAGGYFYASNRLEMPEHGGTHIDAPIHFVRGAHTLDQIPLERLIGMGVRITVAAQCAKDRDYRVTIEDVERWEQEHGKLSDGMIVLLDTGFARYWPSRTEYLGTDMKGPEGVSALHFPGVHPATAAWLVRERKIKAIGIDTASIDYGRSTTFEAHVQLLSHQVPVFENLADLGELPYTGFQVIALPMKIAGGSGGPLRVIAVMPR